MNTNTNNNNQNPNSSPITNDNFDFYLSQTNKIKPKSLKKIDIIHLIRSNRVAELNELLKDISQEDFEENDYFDFNKDELKLIKSYQILMQYMIYSVNQLTRKNQILNDLANKQVSYNEEAEKYLEKQQKKIKEQEEVLGDLTNNCINMEYLIKQLHLEDQVNGLGMNNINKESNLMNEEECDKLRNNMENPVPKNLEGHE